MNEILRREKLAGDLHLLAFYITQEEGSHSLPPETFEEIKKTHEKQCQMLTLMNFRLLEEIQSLEKNLESQVDTILNSNHEMVKKGYEELSSLWQY